MITTMLHGMAMALADSVPGVSGGTVAFIPGFYERFLGALHDLIRGSGARRRAAFWYLFRFGLGWAAGMGASVLVLSQIFEKNIYFLSSAFLGLTVGAIPFILREEGKNIRPQDADLCPFGRRTGGCFFLSVPVFSCLSPFVPDFPAVVWNYLDFSEPICDMIMLRKATGNPCATERSKIL